MAVPDATPASKIPSTIHRIASKPDRASLAANYRTSGAVWKRKPEVRARENRLDGENKKGIGTKTERRCRLVHSRAHRRMRQMVRLARESLAFASVASFVWMMCSVAAHMG